MRFPNIIYLSLHYPFPISACWPKLIRYCTMSHECFAEEYAYRHRVSASGKHSIHQDLMEGSPSIISRRMRAPAQHIRRYPACAPLLAPRNNQRPLTSVIQTRGLQKSGTNIRHTREPTEMAQGLGRLIMMREKQKPRESRRDMTSKQA